MAWILVRAVNSLVELTLKNKMKLGAFIITYNRAPILEGTIRKVLEQTRPPDLVLVVDNASTDDTKEVVRKNFPHVEYVKLPQNVGPAGASGVGLRWGLDQRCDWIYWGDDDDPPGWPYAFERLMKIAGLADSSDIGGIAAAGGLWDWRKGEIQRIPDSALEGIVGVDTIGGGQQLIIRREAVETVGVPNAELFFGHEELEYCIRLKQGGYRLVVDGDLMLESRAKYLRLGLSQKEVRSLRGPATPHWVRRQYYSTRNYIYMMQHTFRRPDLARRQAVKAMARSCVSWGKGARFGAEYSAHQVRAVADGYAGRMGCTVKLSDKEIRTTT